MLIKVRNNLPGYLDLSPLKNHEGAPLVLKGKSVHELSETDLEHPVVLSVRRAGWLEIVPAVAEPRRVIVQIDLPPVISEPTPVPEMPPELVPQPDFLDEMIAERAAANPAFPAMVEIKLKERRGKRKTPSIKQSVPAEELVMPQIPEDEPQE